MWHIYINKYEYSNYINEKKIDQDKFLEILKIKKTATISAKDEHILKNILEGLENAHRVLSQNKIEKEENRKIKENDQDLMSKVGRLTM